MDVLLKVEVGNTSLEELVSGSCSEKEAEVGSIFFKKSYDGENITFRQNYKHAKIYQGSGAHAA